MTDPNKLVSYPKSGRTWLRLMIAKYLDCVTGLDADLQNLAPLTQAAGLPAIDLDHAGGNLTRAQLLSRQQLARQYTARRVLFVARHFEDTLVSAYHQARYRKDLFDGSLSDFIRSPRFGAGRLRQYYEDWNAIRGTTSDFQVIWYEDMHDDPQGALKTALSFCGVREWDTRHLRTAVDFCEFENLQTMERTDQFSRNAFRARDITREETYKFRKGRVGSFREFFDQSDLSFLREMTLGSANALLRSGQ